jgi:hypothetical protein
VKVDDDDDEATTRRTANTERVIVCQMLSGVLVVVVVVVVVLLTSTTNASFRSQLLHPRVQYVPEPSDVGLIPMDVLTLTDGIVVAWGDLNNDYQLSIHTIHD